MRSAGDILEPSAVNDDFPLDQEDLARVLGAFRGLPVVTTPSMHYVRAAEDGASTAYVFDEDSGMVYILD